MFSISNENFNIFQSLIFYLLLDTKSSANSNYYAKLLEIVLLGHFMGQSAYFALGNSNSLATIDLSGAYTGKERDVERVGK